MPARSATVRLHTEHHRPVVEVELCGPNGRARVARFLVDTGGGAFLVTELVADELRLRRGREMRTSQGRFAPVRPPRAAIGGMELDLSEARCLVEVGRHTLKAAEPIDGMLPGHVLMRYDVIFDYPGAAFTLAPPGSVAPRGIPVEVTVDPVNGFLRVEAEVGRERHGFLVDTGATYSMISEALLRKWASRHRDWSRAKGATGYANMGVPGEPDLMMLRIPQLSVGPLRLYGIGAVARQPGTFEEWMSEMTPGPVVGALARNVWDGFRVHIDYAHSRIHLSPHRAPDPHDMDLVGLVLRPEPYAPFVVEGVSDTADEATRAAVRPGDRLLAVDGVVVAGLPLQAVADRLRGAVGEVRELMLQREGRQLRVAVPVARIL